MIIFGRWNLYAFWEAKIKYFSPEGATNANDFLCSSILAVLLTRNFYINNFYRKNCLLLLVFIF